VEKVKIFICGFMGSGKTTFAKNLKLDKTVDLDEVIFQKYAQNFENLGAYIEDRGWDNFRKIELLEVEKICSSPMETMAISLGGGALSNKSMSLINAKDRHILVWLNTPFEVCFERISGDKNRPLAKRQKQELASLFQERSKLYSRAQIQLSVSEQNKIRNVGDLLKYLDDPKANGS